ncbi:MAG TPA: DUF3482 domain-containing protein, partial [Ramlibacter sp.]|nr:DUF3482 domain-containing protein [Ramlibacter sp.]
AARPPAPSDAAADVLLLVADEPADLERLLPALRAAGRPVLLLAAGGSEAAHEVLLRGVGAPAQVLSLHALPNWTADPRLLDALSRVLPSYRQGGLERLRTAWMDRAQARFAAAMRLLAQELIDAAADTEPLGSLGLRQLVLANEREAGREAREQARTVLLQRLHERRQATDARLLETHGALAHGSLPEPAVALDWQPQQKVDARQAGLAGAASGAAMGATLDLMTGVMTLGAASALGGLIGGGAAFAAAAWRNTTGQGAAQGLAMSDEMLQTLAELALLRYLAVAHAQRLVPQDTRERWPSAVRQAIQQHRPALEQAWVRARERADGEHAVAALAVTLRDAVRPLLS